MKNKIILVILISSMLYLLVISIKPSHSKLSKTANSKNTIILKTSSMQYNFDYTGGEQTFTIPYDGKYKLETWGAQGGTYDDNFHGGLGGYSIGNSIFSVGKTLFIYIGGLGSEYSKTATSLGGYNGGGNGGISDSSIYKQGGAGGGGATHISTKSGLLSSLENNKDSILIVSGGGGSSGLNGDANGAASAGGGYIGNPGLYQSDYKDYYATGGTQTSGGIEQTYSKEGATEAAFGQGGNFFGLYGGNGGGGGYFGGGGTSRSHSGSGGGSGYIGNTSLTDKHMACYDCETSNEESTKTISNTCASETPTSDCSKIGNGYARITYLGK